MTRRTLGQLKTEQHEAQLWKGGGAEVGCLCLGEIVGGGEFVSAWFSLDIFQDVGWNE